MKKGKVSKKKSECSNKMMVLMIICVLLSLTTLGIVAYDKLIKNNNNECKKVTNADGTVWHDCWNK